MEGQWNTRNKAAWIAGQVLAISKGALKVWCFVFTLAFSLAYVRVAKLIKTNA